MTDIRMTRRQVLSGLAAAGGLLAFGAILQACGGSASPAPSGSAASSGAASPATAGGSAGKVKQVVVGYTTEPDTLLSGASLGAYTNYLLNAIANGLTRLKHPAIEVDKDLADSWNVSSDGKTYDFTLKKGVKWQDGQPFTAQDVKFTYELLGAPEFAGPAADDIALIQGADAYTKKTAKEITGVKVVDDSHVSFVLNNPSNMFLATTAAIKVLPQHILKDVNPADLRKHPFARKPVYTGAFQVDEWQGGDHLSFKANPDYFGGKPKLDSIVVKTIADPTAAANALRAGQIAWIPSQVSPDEFDKLTKEAGIQARSLSGTENYFLEFDVTNPLFSDKRVREAMARSLDRKTFIDSVLRGHADLNYGIIPPTEWVYDDKLAHFDFDVAKAKGLLDDAGWKPGSDGIRAKDGKRLSFKLSVTGNNPWAPSLPPFLQAIGVDAQLTQMEFGTWIQTLHPGKFEATVGTWFNWRDPRADLQLNFRSPRRADITGYKNDQVDQLFAQADLAKSRDDEKKLYDQIQEQSANDTLYAYIARLQVLQANRDNFLLPDSKTIPEQFQRMAEWDVK